MSSIISIRNLSLQAVYQNWVSLDQAGVLLDNELDGRNDLGTSWEIELLGRIIEDG